MKDKIEPPKKPICSCGNPDCQGFTVEDTSQSGSRTGRISSTDYARLERMALQSLFNNDVPKPIYLATDFAVYESLRSKWVNPGDGSVKEEDAEQQRLDAEQQRLDAEYEASRFEVKDWILTDNQSVDWQDVVGNKDAFDVLREAISDPVEHKELYEKYRMSPPKGVLLYGPPGCGKTMFAKAAATNMAKIYGVKSEILLINPATIQSKYIGETEKNIMKIFKFARLYFKKHKVPLVVFFDEAEIMFPDRTGRGRPVYAYEQSQVATMLAEIDGMQSFGAFLILATNRQDQIDEALLRDGRIGRKINVKRPTIAESEQILRKVMAEVPHYCTTEELVVAGIESLYNPHYVIREGHVIIASMGIAEGSQLNMRDIAINFCLSDIVSGAMISSIPSRAKSFAFARDKKTGKMEGVKMSDVISAVSQIFEENKNLEHSYAMKEFIEKLPIDEYLSKADKGTLQ